MPRPRPGSRGVLTGPMQHDDSSLDAGDRTAADGDSLVVRSELLRVSNVSKTFPGCLALDDVDFDVQAGEIHALIGHNGSGKSTLTKILAGFHHPDPGAACSFKSESVKFAALRGRHDHLSFVHQDLGLVAEMSAVENLALSSGFIRSRWGRVRWREQERLTERRLAPFGVDFDLRAPVGKLAPLDRTIIAVAAALQGWSSAGGVLVLDEPTAVLPAHEVHLLHEILRNVRADGAGVVYISHRLDEVLELSDRVSVLRDGRKVITTEIAGLTKADLVHQMLGAGLEDAIAPDERAVNDEPLLTVRGLSGADASNVDFTLHRGEVLGFAGLPGSGHDEVTRLLTDRRHEATGGTLHLNDAAPCDIARYRGTKIALVPPDRASEGVIAPMSIAENLTLSTLGPLTTALGVSRKLEARFVDSAVGEFEIQTSDPTLPVATLSGGNQQKVLIGRVLVTNPDVLVLCEPTAGVDVGARAAIRRFVLDKATAGLGAIVVSAELDDLVALCSRVLVFKSGSIVTELVGSEITEHNMVRAAEGLGDVEMNGLVNPLGAVARS